MNKNKNLNLFCVPYAGGSAHYFLKFKEYLPPNINLITLELSGRGKRINEPFYNNFSEAINDLYTNLKPLIEENNYVILGHSMGSYLAFELSLKISEDHLNLPEFIVLSGSTLSNPKSSDNILDLESNESIIKYLHDLGGLNKEIINNKELLEYFLPIIKSDLTILKNHLLTNKKTPTNLIILNGEEDMSISEREHEIWSGYTSKNATSFTFSGGHFFIDSNFKKIIKIIEEEIL